MVMVPLVLHAAACWEKDWGSRGIERGPLRPQTAGEGASGSGSLL